jgi:hypothetical protein
MKASFELRIGSGVCLTTGVAGQSGQDREVPDQPAVNLNRSGVSYKNHRSKERRRAAPPESSRLLVETGE